MNHPHYTPRERPNGAWYFTSPMGLHEDMGSREIAENFAGRIRERHIEKAAGSGAEAEILRAHFDRHEPGLVSAVLPQPPPLASVMFPCRPGYDRHDWSRGKCARCGVALADFNAAIHQRAMARQKAARTTKR